MGDMLIACIVSVLLVTGVHFQALKFANRLVTRISRAHRERVALVILIAVIAHLVEILVFTAIYYWLSDRGDIVFTQAHPSLMDLFYFSGSTFTTVGYGDIVMLGTGRILTVVEAVTGLVMITWTASYTYFEMQRSWIGYTREPF